MCGAVFGFFANLFSNESDYIRAQMDLQTRMAQEKQNCRHNWSGHKEFNKFYKRQRCSKRDYIEQ